jgi:hypothetical protein
VDVKSVIDSYVDDVARRLPRKIRNEVGLELRTLLTDEIASAAAAAGRPADAATALSVLASFGRPEHVAERYGGRRGFNVIEPEHAPAFVKLSVLGVVAQWAFSLPGVFVAPSTFGGWWLESGFAALWWVGLLVVWFGIGAWVQRRLPVEPNSFARPWAHYIFWLPVRQDWQPAQLDHPYSAAKVLIPLASALTIVFVSPEWFLGLFDPTANVSWARYDADFRSQLLPALLVIMVSRIALFTFATVRLHWRARTELVRFGLWTIFVGLLLWALVGWDIFASARVDFLFKVWLSVFLLVNCLQIWVSARNAYTRVRVPKALTGRH